MAEAARNDEEEILESTSRGYVESSDESSTAPGHVELNPGATPQAQRNEFRQFEKLRRMTEVQPEKPETDKMQNKTKHMITKSCCSMALHLERTKSSSHDMSNAWMSTKELSTESENSKPKRRGASFEGEVATEEAVKTEKAKKETEVERG